MVTDEFLQLFEREKLRADLASGHPQICRTSTSNEKTRHLLYTQEEIIKRLDIFVIDSTVINSTILQRLTHFSLPSLDDLLLNTSFCLSIIVNFQPLSFQFQCFWTQLLRTLMNKLYCINFTRSSDN